MNKNHIELYVPLDGVINLFLSEPKDKYVEKIKSLSNYDIKQVIFSEWIDNSDPGSFTCGNCEYVINR